jgi:hypothetical protein
VIQLVGAARFERPPPGAQGRFWPSSISACFLTISISAVYARRVERRGFVWNPGFGILNFVFTRVGSRGSTSQLAN